MPEMNRVAFYTLGCKVNYYETEALKSLFEKRGYQVVNFTEEADVYVINTCTVTHESNRKSRRVIRRARRFSSAAIVVVTGCYPQVYPQELQKMPESDLVVGTHRRHNLPEMVEKFHRKEIDPMAVEPFDNTSAFEKLPFREAQGRTRAFLKIQEGCHQGCSYCVVPLARGPVRSKPAEEILNEVYQIASLGYREIVFTGIHLGWYGKDLWDISLAALMEKVEAVTGIERVRLSSLEPLDLTEELIEYMVYSSKFCRHLHIPIQSGDDEILRKMYRPYNTYEYRLLLDRLRNAMPDLAVSTDLMVGFPGETEEHHIRSKKLVKKIKFSRMHVFKFSPRPGTDAYHFSHKVSPSEKSRRSKEMREVGRILAAEYGKSFLGTRQEVLVEKVNKAGEIEGFTQHYLRIRAGGTEMLDLQKIQGARVFVDLMAESTEGEGLIGQVYSKA